MKVWITKYALTTGITEAEATRTDTERMVKVLGNSAKRELDHYVHKPDWHETREAAVTRAEEMRTKKIASLEKQIAKLRKLKFK